LRIHVVRSGGIAGLRSEHDLDTDQLPGADRERLANLVHAVAFFALAQDRSSRLPDMIQYRVRIEDSGRAHEVVFDDACGEPPLLELVDTVAELARAMPH
jgi:hypothetical protein